MASNSFGLCGEDSLQASPAKKRSGTHAHRTSRALHHHFSSKVSHLSGISASALPRPARKARTRFGHHGPFEVLRSEEHTSELQSRGHLVCRLLLEKKKKKSALVVATTRRLLLYHAYSRAVL